MQSLGHSSDNEALELLLNNYWRPTLSVTGLEGLPPFERAGNVVYKEMKVRVSLRLPPTLKADKATEIVREILTQKRD